MSTYVKKEDGTLIESDTEVVKVESDNLSKILKNKTNGQYFFGTYNGSILPELDEDAFANLTNINYMFYNCSKITNLFNLKFDKATSSERLFANCNNLTEINVELPLSTSMISCFVNCSKLKNINLNIGTQSINLDNMFSYCDELESITINKELIATSCEGMFIDCKKLKTIPQINTSNVTNFRNMFFGCNFEITPLIDTSKATDIRDMFSQYGLFEKSILKVISAYDFSNVIYATGVVSNAMNLEQFLPTGLKVSFNLSASTKFTREALVVVLNNLGTPTSTQTLTLGSTNLAKLTEEDIAIATEKNWTLK